MQRLSSPWFAVIAALVLMAAWALMATAGEKTEKTVAEAPTAFEQSRDIGTRALCPVTRRELTIKEKTARSEHKGRHYVFCCPGCKPKFDKDPANYLSQERQGGR